MSTTRHKTQETVPRRQYQGAVVVPLVVFAFLAGAAAGYSIGRMGRDDCTEVPPVVGAAASYSATHAAAQTLTRQPEEDGARALGVQCAD